MEPIVQVSMPVTRAAIDSPLKLSDVALLLIICPPLRRIVIL